MLGEKELATIPADDVDAALVRLAERGQLKGGKRATTATGKPIAGSTVNRYVSQLGSIFNYAKRLKLVPRTFVSLALHAASGVVPGRSPRSLDFIVEKGRVAWSGTSEQLRAQPEELHEYVGI